MSSEPISTDRPVLVVGATGDLGSRVVKHLVDTGRPVRALLRTGSDDNRLPAAAASVRGDLLDGASLDHALSDVGVVVTTATGYGGWQHPDPRVDSEGNRNLAAAAARAGIDRLVFTSVLAAEQAERVEPFWQKHLSEHYLEQIGVPFLSLRAGTIIGGHNDFWASGLERGRLTAMTRADAKISYIHIDDLARCLVAASGPLPDGIAGPLVQVGTQPATYKELAALFTELLGTPIKLRAIPWPLISASTRALGLVSHKAHDFGALMSFLASGSYTADPRWAQRLLGHPLSLRATLERYLSALNLPAGEIRRGTRGSRWGPAANHRTRVPRWW